MIKSACLCQKKSLFKKIIEYQNEKVFSQYEGIIIGRCQKCGLSKTFLPQGLKQQLFESRPEIIFQKKEIFFPIYKKIVEKIKKYKKRGEVLDVGCSAGILSKFLKDEGYYVFGIEPNKKAHQLAKKILEKKVFLGNLSDFLKKKKKKFDIVIYNHVLEHIQDINQELKLIKKVLAKNGLLVLGTPNYANIIFFLRQKYWESLMPSEHHWHFSKKNLITLLKKFHFRILDVSFDNDQRLDYPLIKRVYFNFLSFVNKILHTGESILIIAQSID